MKYLVSKYKVSNMWKQSHISYILTLSFIAVPSLPVRPSKIFVVNNINNKCRQY